MYTACPVAAQSHDKPWCLQSVIAAIDEQSAKVEKLKQVLEDAMTSASPAQRKELQASVTELEFRLQELKDQSQVLDFRL